MSALLLLASLLTPNAHAQSLTVTGSCPGTVSATVAAAPGARIAWVVGTDDGSTLVPGGSCAGTPLDLSSPALAGMRRVPASGEVSLVQNTGPLQCDALIQAIDLDTCATSAAWRVGPARDYTATGPFEVGSRVLPVRGSSGANLPSEVWYPAARPGVRRRVYQTSGYPDGNGDAWVSAPADCSTPRPVLVHSHGNLSLPFEMFDVMEFLASHGWLVLAPEHTGNSWNNSWGIFPSATSRRPADVADAYQALVDEASDPISPLFGCVDESDGYVVSGNSFGGYTAYAVGGALVNDLFQSNLDLSDPRATAIVTYVPWDAFGALTDGTSNVTVPVLTFGGERDATVGTDYQRLFSYVSSRPRVGYSFPDAGHLSFTPLWCVSAGDGCGASFTPLRTTVGTAQTATLSFLEDLRGRSGALEQLPLQGPFSVRSRR